MSRDVVSRDVVAEQQEQRDEYRRVHRVAVAANKPTKGLMIFDMALSPAQERAGPSDTTPPAAVCPTLRGAAPGRPRRHPPAPPVSAPGARAIRLGEGPSERAGDGPLDPRHALVCRRQIAVQRALPSLRHASRSPCSDCMTRMSVTSSRTWAIEHRHVQGCGGDEQTDEGFDDPQYGVISRPEMHRATRLYTARRCPSNPSGSAVTRLVPPVSAPGACAMRSGRGGPNIAIPGYF